MNGLAVLLLLALLAEPIFAQMSFEEHRSAIANRTLAKREAAFAKACRVKFNDATVAYGESVDEKFTFQPRQNAGNGVADAKTDFFGTVEVWKTSGRPRLLNAWMLTMDTGEFSNEMFCLDSLGKVIMQETLNGYQPIVASNGGWLHLQRKKFLPTSNPNIGLNAFVNRSGHPVSVPQLDAGDYEQALASVKTQFAADVIAKLNRRSR